MIASFGTRSPTGADCAVGGSWESWCDCMWPSDSATNEKCRKSLPGAPWTLVGSALRGIPFYGTISASDLPMLPGAAGGAAAPASGGEGIFGIPNTVLYVGLGILGAGALALAMSGRKKRPAMSGYKRRRKH